MALEALWSGRMPMARRATLAVGFCLSLCGAGVSGDTAAAASLVYQSQTGSFWAQGGTPTLGSDSDGGTISGLANVDEQASVAAGSPPNFYSASVDIHTTLDPTRLRAEGHASAAAGPVFGDPVGYAGTQAAVTILFDLDVPAPIRIDIGNYSDWEAFATLRFLDFGPGFAIQLDHNGAWSFPCAWDDPLCVELVKMSGEDGGILPAGHYQLDFSFSAWEPGDSPCEYGCHHAGGTMTIEIVPEPASFGLLGVGLALLATARREEHGSGE